LKVDVKGTIVSDEESLFYSWYGMTHTAPKMINKAVNEARLKNETLDVYVNSGGGDIFAGSEIYTALKSYNNVKIHVVGLAASATSMISMAGESDITETGMVMIHNVSSYAEGDYNAMKHSAEVLEKANKAIASAYIAKTGLSEKEVLALMNKETWLTAKEAVEQGFINKITNVGRLVASNNCMFLNSQAIEYAKKMINSEKTNKLKNELEFLKLKRRDF
jgi:ATP-dependent protease ClpP protease subunit